MSPNNFWSLFEQVQNRHFHTFENRNFLEREKRVQFNKIQEKYEKYEEECMRAGNRMLRVLTSFLEDEEAIDEANFEASRFMATRNSELRTQKRASNAESRTSRSRREREREINGERKESLLVLIFWV